MAEDHPPRDDSAADTETFEQWLSQTAEAKNVSERELMDNLLSSYWILDELTEFMQDTAASGDSGTGSDRTPSTHGDSAETSSSDSAGGAGNLDDLTNEIETLKTLISEVTELQRALDAGGDREPRSEQSTDRHPDPDYDPRNAETLIATLTDLQQQVDDLSEEIDKLRTRQDSHIDQVSDDLQFVYSQLEEIDASAGSFATEAELEALSDEVDSELGDVRDAQDELESYVESEFDSIEDAMRHLLDITDDTESRVDALAESLTEEVEPLKDDRSEREQLAQLRRDAMEQGVREAACDNCDQKIDLAMLDAPYCPGCDRSFSDVSDGGWNPFKSARLKTAPIAATSDASSDAGLGSSESNRE